MSIAKNHKLSCVGQGNEKFILNKSVELIQQELQTGYSTDSKTKEILDDELNKRNKMHQKKRRNQVKTIITVMGAILSIYLAIYVASRAATMYVASKQTVEANINNPLPMEKPDNQQQFTKTLPIDLNNKSKKLMSQLWKEALMSLYMDFKSFSQPAGE